MLITTYDMLLLDLVMGADAKLAEAEKNDTGEDEQAGYEPSFPIFFL